jgi:hypothetical protein
MRTVPELGGKTEIGKGDNSISSKDELNQHHDSVKALIEEQSKILRIFLRTQKPHT